MGDMRREEADVVNIKQLKDSECEDPNTSSVVQHHMEGGGGNEDYRSWQSESDDTRD